MRVFCTWFTSRGEAVARRIGRALPGDEVVLRGCMGADGMRLGDWAREAFAQADALVVVGAAGIAVRGVAPLVTNKATDPAVLVVDEAAMWCIPILSGHLGGANELARLLSSVLGATPVITTATDVRGIIAVDEWARRFDLDVLEPARIKTVSAAVLRGERVTLFSDVELPNELPGQTVRTTCRDDADIVVSPQVFDDEPALHLVPRCVVAGIGCRRGITPEAVENAVAQALCAVHVPFQALIACATIDIKRDEEGLSAWARIRSLDISYHSARELATVSGSVSTSPFVERVTGVDNVCERAALARAKTLLAPKAAYEGVTVALASTGRIESERM